ncbi:hypothetical protein FRX31_022546 [Thalictrum thalictroides]|uniref:Uncharacterized protein n=1 Tax=Thalictrum thalictroides TaxID=46969 RepID=A0A7J6VT03_THATH|nr:hypothetical protein FRX31_022546 [Thalictrum thalictroides]
MCQSESSLFISHNRHLFIIPLKLGIRSDTDTLNQTDRSKQCLQFYKRLQLHLMIEAATQLVNEVISECC